MKNFALLFFCFITSFSFSQENTERINQIEKEIKLVLLEEDYQKAADLKAEKLILIEIDKALINKDYQKAADLKEQLETGQVAKKKNSKSPNSSKASYESIILKNGFLAKAYLGGGFAGNTSSRSPIGAFGLELSYRFYFGESKFYRPGIQITGLNASVLYNIPSEFIGVSLAPLNLGMSNLFEFTQNIGAEVNLNFGYNILLNTLDRSLYSDFVTHGVRVNPEIKFRYKENSVGLDINVVNNIYSVRGGIGVSPMSTFSLSYGRSF